MKRFFIAALLLILVLSAILTSRIIERRKDLNCMLEEYWVKIINVEHKLSDTSMLEALETDIIKLKYGISACKRKRVLLEKEECYIEVVSGYEKIEKRAIILIGNNKV